MLMGMAEDRNFTRESKAFEALAELMRQAAVAKSLFDEAGLETPSPLARLLGTSSDTPKHRDGVTVAKPMPTPPRPEGADPEWVFIPLEGAYATTIVRGVLRGFGKPERPKKLLERVLALRPDIMSGSVYNTGPRLEKAGVVKRGPGGWELVRPEENPVISGDFLWSDIDILQKQEVALHRRMIIVHLLGVYRSGLQIVQIVERLREFPQCKANANKDLVQSDMDILQQEKKARRVSSRKWVLIQEVNE